MLPSRRHPFGNSPKIARAVIVFPLPVSPTIPVMWLDRAANETPRRIGTSARPDDRSTRRPSTRRVSSASTKPRIGSLLDPVGDECERENRHGQKETGEDREPPLPQGDLLGAGTDHRAPLRRRRRRPETEKSEAG